MAREQKHTPGPWDASGLTVYDTCLDGVASTHTAADALLIAAAPELLALAEALDCECDSYHGHRCRRCIVIAKARGEAG